MSKFKHITSYKKSFPFLYIINENKSRYASRIVSLNEKRMGSPIWSCPSYEEVRLVYYDIIIFIYNVLNILDMVLNILLAHSIHFQHHGIAQPGCHFSVCKNIII